MKTISSRQLAVLCSLMLFSIKLLLLPSLLFQDLKLFSVILLIIFLFIDILILFLILKIKEKYDKMRFFDILSSFFGKIGAKIIYFILFLFFTIKMVFLINESFLFLQSSLYEQATLFLYLLCLIPVVNVIAFRGVRAMARTAEFYYYFIMLGIIVCMALSLVEESQVIMAFKFPDVGQFFGSALKRVMWFGDYIFVFLLFDNIQYEKKQTIKKTMTYTIVSGAILVLLYVLYLRLFQTTSFIHSQAIGDLLQFATKIGNVGKIDIISALTIMFIIVFQMSVYFFCCSQSLVNIYKKDKICLAVTNIVTIFLCWTVFTNLQSSSIFLQSSWIIGIIINYVIPIVLSFSLLKKVKLKGAKQ